MASKPRFLQLPPDLRNIIYRYLAKEDIKTCLVLASSIAISHPITLVSKQLQSEFVPILEELYPGAAAGSIPSTVCTYLVDIASVGPRKLSTKVMMISAHVREHGIRNFKVKYVNIGGA